MALHKLVRRNYSRKLVVSIKYQNLHSFKEGMILLYQSILETGQISHLHGFPLFTVPLTKENDETSVKKNGYQQSIISKIFKRISLSQSQQYKPEISKRKRSA